MNKFTDTGYVEALINAGQVYMAYGTQSPVSVWLVVFQIDGCPPDAALVAGENRPTVGRLWNILPQCEEARAEDGMQEHNLTLHSIYPKPVAVVKGGQRVKTAVDSTYSKWIPLLTDMTANIVKHYYSNPGRNLQALYRDNRGRTCNIGGLVSEATWQNILHDTDDMAENHFLEVLSSSLDITLVMGTRTAVSATGRAAIKMQKDIMKSCPEGVREDEFIDVLQALQEWYDLDFLNHANGHWPFTNDVAGLIGTVKTAQIYVLAKTLEWHDGVIREAKTVFQEVVIPTN